MTSGKIYGEKGAAEKISFKELKTITFGFTSQSSLHIMTSVGGTGQIVLCFVLHLQH